MSSRSKHGTTWVQAILLHLVHGPELPAPLSVLSPWVDHLVEPVQDLAERLAAQDHRRVLKTHTPLDGVPTAPGVHRVVVARHPLDAALSLYHQGANIDRERLARLTGSEPSPGRPRPGATAWLGEWTRAEHDPAASLDSLQGVAHHLRDAWERRDEVALLHYADLLADLPGQVRHLADAAGLADAHVGEVVAATGFDAMRSRAARYVPDAAGVLADHGAFFRRGGSGGGRDLLDDASLAVYRDRMAGLLAPELDAWLHR